MLRRFKEDCREFPATMSLCALWAIVFVAMVAAHHRQGNGLSFGQTALGLRGGHHFGDMTLRELFQGDLWRPLTATFVHYGVLHVGMNLFALYQLGALVESWYGSSILVGIYVITGAGGNLLSGVLRHLIGSNPMIASGGGSTVVMGLVGLCAVVGWRSRTTIGDSLRNQMLWVLGVTAALGLVLRLLGMPIIDNWGHAGGTIMGALIGLANRPLARLGETRSAAWIGLVGSLLIATSALAQYRDDRDESRRRVFFAQREQERARVLETLMIRLDEVRQTYRAVASPRIIYRGMVSTEIPRRPRRITTKDGSETTLEVPADPEEAFFQTVIEASLKSLLSMAKDLEPGGTSADYQRLVVLTRQTQSDPPTLEEFREFESRMLALEERLRRQRDYARIQSITIGFLPRID